MRRQPNFLGKIHTPNSESDKTKSSKFSFRARTSLSNKNV